MHSLRDPGWLSSYHLELQATVPHGIENLSLAASQYSVLEVTHVISALYSLTRINHMASPNHLGARKYNSPMNLGDWSLMNSTNGHHNILNKYLVTNLLPFLRKSSWIFLPVGFSFISLLEDLEIKNRAYRIVSRMHFIFQAVVYFPCITYSTPGTFDLLCSLLALTILWKPETETYRAPDQHGKKHLLGSLSRACLVSHFFPSQMFLH